MSTIKSFSIVILLICLPSILWALPQDLDAFYDFENITAEGSDFTIGQAPFTIRVINFTLETVENPNLAHSGTKALVLVPGAQEGSFSKEEQTWYNFMRPRPRDPAGSSCATRTFFPYLNKD